MDPPDSPLSSKLNGIGLFFLAMSAFFWFARGPATNTGQLLFRLATLALGIGFTVAGLVVRRMENGRGG